MTAKSRRMATILAALAVLGIATALVINALGGATSFFVTPDELETRSFAPGQALRLGGLVAPGTVAQQGTSATTAFEVTNAGASVRVIYTGLLPDLFREGQGIVAEGKLDSVGVFQASRVLAKHDENYMPPELAEKLKADGTFRPADTLS